MTYKGRPSIHAIVLEVLDERETDFGVLYERICAHPAYEGRPAPNKRGVNNVVNRMAHNGEIVKVRRQVFKGLPATAGAENPDESGGGPHPAQLDVEQSPGEQSMPAHRGHPYGEGSADAAPLPVLNL